MNVLQIINLSSVYPGNLMASLWDLEKSIEKEGKCIYLFPVEAKKLDWIQEMIQNDKVLYFKTGNKLEDIKLIVQISQKHELDIIHLHFWNIPDCLAIKLAKVGRKGLESVIHHHSMYAVSSSNVREKIKRWILAGNHHIAVSEGMWQQYIDWKFDKSTLFLVNNCVVFSRLNTYEDKRNGKNSILVFSSCGCLIKGIDIACRAIQLLNEKQGATYNLSVVCSEKPDEVETFIRDVFAGEIPEWIKILQPRTDIATYYKGHRIFLSSSRSEGFCMALLEATYCECETIQSRIVGHRLDIPECKTFESENVVELANRIEDVFAESEEERVRINKLQKEYVVQEYGIERWSRNVMDVYHKIQEQ